MFGTCWWFYASASVIQLVLVVVSSKGFDLSAQNVLGQNDRVLSFCVGPKFAVIFL
jgi:hypothetical protein